MYGDRQPTFFPVSATKTRRYQWEFKLYPDSTDYNIKEVIELLKLYFSQWAWILHDKDLLELNHERLRVCSLDQVRITGAFRKCVRKRHIPLAKPHVHFYGRNGSHCNISKQQIVKYLHLPYSYNHRPNDIKPISDWEACLEYTVHRNAPEKYQYDIKRVKTNVRGFAEIIAQKHTMNDDLKTLYAMLEEAKRKNEIIPYYELVRKLTLKGCTIQFYRSRMVKDISESFQYYEMSMVVK